MKVLIDIDAQDYAGWHLLDEMGMGSQAIRAILAGDILPTNESAFKIELDKAIKENEKITNGGVIESLFPYLDITVDENACVGGLVLIDYAGSQWIFDWDWWHAPYKGVDNE